MAQAPRSTNTKKPPKRVSPFVELGASGVAVFGGRILNREKDQRVAGLQRWLTFSEMATNTSIVAAGVRYFLNIVAHAQWTAQPAEESQDAEEAAEFVEKVINNMETPWRRVMRRASMYRFNGFGIQEWTAKRREEDGKIGIQDIEARPSHTITRWEVDDKGTVEGVWQQSPQSNKEVYLPRSKVLYLVEDSLTDSPEGLGLFRHLVEPYERLKIYLTLEGRGFERDLRGIPIGRVPYTAINKAVKEGAITEDKAKLLVASIENFVKTQVKGADTSIVLDSIPYVVDTDSGPSLSGIMQYGIELLQGQTPAFGDMSNAVARLNQEMARIIGVEHLLLGGEGGANRALSEDKSRNFYLTVNGTLSDIADGGNKDIVSTICDLNGIPEKFRPKLKHSDVSFRAVTEITASLSQLATSGAVLAPDDPAIDQIREMLGLKPQPERTPEQMGLMIDTHVGEKDPVQEEKDKIGLEREQLGLKQQEENPELGAQPPPFGGKPRPGSKGPKGTAFNKRRRKRTK